MKMTFFLRFDAFSQWISRHPQLVWRFPLNDFVEMIAFAKKRLIEMQKPPEH
jgi:hypothetical protein